jgi:hypothetical protein
MALKVIGAGGPRTGTASLKTALETLGFGECSHMEGLFNNPHLVDYWVEFFETGKTDFNALFDGFQSTSDFPGYLLYKEMLELYPDAKVILNDRDPEEWYESFAKTVNTFVPQTFSQKFKIWKKGIGNPRFQNIAKTLRLVEVYLLKRHYKGQFLNKAQTLKIYRDFNDEIRRTVPAGQLLEYHISQGWEPLCEFLEVPVPDAPFPHRNARNQFIAQLSKMLDTGGKLKLK